MLEFRTHTLCSRVSRFPEMRIAPKSQEEQRFIQANLRASRAHFGKRRLDAQVNLESLEKFAALLRPVEARSQPAGPGSLRRQPTPEAGPKPEAQPEPRIKPLQPAADDESDMFGSSDESMLSAHKVYLGKRDSIKIRVDSPQKDLKAVLKDIRGVVRSEKSRAQKDYYMECFPDMAEQVEYSGDTRRGRAKRPKNVSFKSQFKKIQDINAKK